MKNLILLAGLPGVGKSTISKKISEKTGAEILDLDDFKRIHVDSSVVTSQIDPPDVRWRYYEKALEHAFDLFKDRNISTILMDEVFHLEHLREKLENLCIKNQVSVFWVEVRCPYFLVEDRLKKQERKGHILSTEEALNMYLLFQKLFEEFPAHSLNHIIVDNEMDSDKSVEEILKKISN